MSGRNIHICKFFCHAFDGWMFHKICIFSVPENTKKKEGFKLKIHKKSLAETNLARPEKNLLLYEIQLNSITKLNIFFYIWKCYFNVNQIIN